MANPQPWWKNAVIYQIYPRSFQDSNGDGIGDLAGIIQRLGYLESLGIDAIWLSPVYRSPQDDNGYDISDYCDIDPMFGTLADMDNLITEAKKHHIRIIIDLVLNHSSDEHRWFQEAKKETATTPTRLLTSGATAWRSTPPQQDAEPPLAARPGPGCPRWGRYYFHQFSIKQPNLGTGTTPPCGRELYKAIHFWMDKETWAVSAGCHRPDRQGPGPGITSTARCCMPISGS